MEVKIVELKINIILNIGIISESRIHPKIRI